MYSVGDMIKAAKRPRLIPKELNRAYHHFRAGEPYNTEGIDIFKEDWDNLIILDSCRYDYLAAQIDLPGELESRISRGAMSEEFIRGNFSGKIRHGVVYVSANGWYGKLKDELNAEIHKFIVAPDDVMGMTTTPETVSELAREADDEHPNKRLIIHYMQPHQPFIGETGQTFNYEKGHEIQESDNISHPEIIQAYEENLELVLDEVKTLLPGFQGKTVITSDHGELLGETQRPIPVKTYGHPKGVHVEELIKVPWFICEFSERKVIEPEPPEDELQYPKKKLDQRLKNLGYL